MKPSTTVRRHRPDYQIIVFMGLLLLIGVVVLANISPARVALLGEGGSSVGAAFFMQKQLAYLGLGLVGFILASIIPIAMLQKHAGRFLIAAFIICMGLVVVGNIFKSSLAICTLGACRWVNLGFASFQPAELVKFGLVLYAASFIAMRMKQGSLDDLKKTFIPLGIVMGVASLFIIVLQKDLGTGITLFGILAAMLFAAGIKKKTALIIGATIVGLLVVFIVMAPHRIDRVLTFFAPHSATDASSYHIDQAKIALGSGGLLGVGLGKSVQAFGYLPEAINDSIFAIMGELFGFVGLIGILFLMFALLTRILKVMDRTADDSLRLVVAGIFGWIATHVIVNIAAMTGIFPLTGITLPLLSFGGTSMLFVMIILGIVFQASRYTAYQPIVAKKETTTHEDTSRRRGIGGTRYPGRRGYNRA